MFDKDLEQQSLAPDNILSASSATSLTSLEAVGAVDMPALPFCEAPRTFLLSHEVLSPCHCWKNCLLLQC